MSEKKLSEGKENTELRPFKHSNEQHKMEFMTLAGKGTRQGQCLIGNQTKSISFHLREEELVLLMSALILLCIQVSILKY